MKTKEQPPKKLEIHFGALAQPIGKQLKKQGFKYSSEPVSHFDKQAEAIMRLRFASLISDSVASKATQKLFKKIERYVAKENQISL